ncbi:MAG: hypothetical protein ACK41Z_13835, partial [Sediminibacterium sp.]
NDINNINEFFDAGIRVMSIAHFFDNQLGGSAHGTEKVPEYSIRKLTERYNFTKNIQRSA